ncbi:uncharacterized protein LOC34621190 [Cyclospora cayetanensis]|uniref:Uncharacterized protein LOC34621190 n=1 Tax=Cyclospora cayetanensis TaxID=88456 RepID=A0A6P6RQK2_9EIME|nr:uncharacterized protein LOC34621190 [Cyclospora cayetanensis]
MAAVAFAVSVEKRSPLDAAAKERRSRRKGSAGSPLGLRLPPANAAAAAAPQGGGFATAAAASAGEAAASPPLGAPAELAPVAASPVSSVEAVSPFAGVGAAAATAEAIRLAYRKSDWCALTAVTEKLLREAQQQQHEGQPHLVEDKARLLTPALLLLSLLQPPQRDGRVQRLLAAVKEIVQQQPHTRHPLPLSPGEAATLLAALGNLRAPFDGEASAALACILVATAREQRLLQDGGKAPAETSQTWVDAAFPLLRRLLKGRGLSPEQACSVLQAAAYHAFFPQRLALLLPHTFPAAPWSLASKATTIPPGIAAGASRGPCSPAPLYIEALSACAEASDTPEALGLAATVTEAINRITVALQSSRNGEEVLSVEAILRLTEALVLRDFSFTSQLTTLAAHPQSAHEEQVQQTQQLWQAYKKDLDELLELLLDSFLRQRQQWGPYTVQELLLFLLGILRLFGLGNLERLSLTAMLSSSTHQQPQWQHLSECETVELLTGKAHSRLRELWLNLAKASSINSTTDAALLLRALSLLCSSGTTLNLASCDVTPCGALAAAAAAAAPPTSFGEDLERWGQQLLLQWQLVEAADFVPRPAAALQQQQLAEVDVHLKQQKQRAAQLQAKTAAQILQPSTGSTNLVPGTDAAPAVPNPSAVKSTSRTATPLVQPAAEAGPSVPLLLKAATESIFHSSATVSPPAALLLLRSFVALNSCGDFLAPSEAGAAGLAAMAFRSAALLQLYRSLQRQYLALMQHRQKQLSREQPRQLERDQQPERDSQQHGSQRQHEETQSRLRQLRQSLRFVQQQQLRLLDMLCRHDRQHTHARETAAGLIPLAAASLLRPAHLKLVTPSLLEDLHAYLQQPERQQDAAAAVVSLLTLKCLLPPGAFPEELLLQLLQVAKATVEALQPRALAVCLYSLQPQERHSQQVSLLQQDLRGCLLHRATLLLPFFPPEELLLLVAALVGISQNPLLQRAFGCMYTAIPFYTPQQLATPLCGLAKALAANPDICLGAPLALPPDGEVAGEQELADRGGKAAASSLKASEDTAAAPHELLCCASSLPVTIAHQQRLSQVLLEHVKERQVRQSRQQKRQNVVSRTAQKMQCPRRVRLLQLLEPPALLQLLVLQLERQQHSHCMQQLDLALIRAACKALRPHLQELGSKDLLELVAALHKAQLSGPPKEKSATAVHLEVDSVSALLFPLLTVASVDVPARAATTAFGSSRAEYSGSKSKFIPSRFFWKIGSLLKKDIGSYSIPMHVLAQHALALTLCALFKVRMVALAASRDERFEIRF